MRIAHVTSLLSRRSAGVRVAVEQLARAQQALGHEVCVIGQADQDYLNGDYGDFLGLEVRACRVTGPEQLGYSLSMSREILNFAPDVIHLHGLWQLTAHSVLSVHRLIGVPFVISIHGMLGAVPLTYSPRKKWLARKLFQDEAFQRAACLHATSSLEAEDILNFGLGKPVITVPNGISRISVPDVGPATSNTILSLGRIHPKKGLDVLIDAWASIEPEFLDWQVQLVGPDENNHAAELTAQIRRLGLQRCHISGPVYGAERDRLMVGAALFVLPTRSENFALTVGESLMMGVPVISSKGAPWAGLETEGCGLWVDLTPAALAKAMCCMMSMDPETRRDMGRRGRAWMIRDFSWAAVADQMLEAYRWMGRQAPAPNFLTLSEHQ